MGNACSGPVAMSRGLESAPTHAPVPASTPAEKHGDSLDDARGAELSADASANDELVTRAGQGDESLRDEAEHALGRATDAHPRKGAADAVKTTPLPAAAEPAAPAPALSLEPPEDLSTAGDRSLLGLRDEPLFIPDVAMRGITLRQLERILATVQARCAAGSRWWTISGDGRWEAVAVAEDEVTLYHFNSTLLKPLTKMRGSSGATICSLVELMADSPQPPAAFVSHWWGEPIAHFVACIRQYVSDRSYDADTPFWVRAQQRAAAARQRPGPALRLAAHSAFLAPRPPARRCARTRTTSTLSRSAATRRSRRSSRRYGRAAGWSRSSTARRA